MAHAAAAVKSTPGFPFHTEKTDPLNFGAEGLDPQHIALFNGATGGRFAPVQRTEDTGLALYPTLLHPEIVTDILKGLNTPSTCNGAQAWALAGAGDAPENMKAIPPDPITVSPPLELADLPPPPPDPVARSSSGISSSSGIQPKAK